MQTSHAIRYLGPATSNEGGGADSPEPNIPGIEVVDTVSDGAGPDRTGLAAALEQIATGQASVLLVARLRAAAGSLRDLVGLLEWLQDYGADLVAEDIRLDTRTPAGRRVVAALREVASWEHDPDPGRPRPGRPGLHRLAPELTEQIAALRSSGLTLQGIADRLNAQGTATPRGGAQWRPSSVQAVLGYRRPRPPAPGLRPRRGRPPAPEDPPPPGGPAAPGGRATSGGRPASGGAPPPGGRPASAGAPASGGTPASGGRPAPERPRPPARPPTRHRPSRGGRP